jgi:hypothetical protein
VTISTGFPAGMVTPWNSRSATEKRPWYWLGARQRSTSSTAEATNDGSAISAACWSGCSAKVMTPLPTSLVTVSAPAAVSSAVK